MKNIIDFLRNNYIQIYKGFIFTVVVLAIVYMLPREAKFYYEYQLNRPWKYESLIAVDDIPLLKTDEELTNERKALSEKISRYFYFDTTVNHSIFKSADRYFDTIWLKTIGLRNMDNALSAREKMNQLLTGFLDKGIVSPSSISEDQVVIVMRNGIEKPVFFGDFVKLNQVERHLKTEKSLKDTIGLVIKQSIIKSLMANVIYDSVRTKTEYEKANLSISPYQGVLLQGQLVISQGEVVSAEKYRLLESIKHHFETKKVKSVWNILLGQIILVSIPLFVFLLWLYYFRRDLFDETKNVLLFLLLIALMVFVSRIAISFGTSYLLIVPLAINILIVRAFYDSRLALIVHLTAVLLVSYFVPNSFQFLFLQVITGIITIVSVVKLHKRSQFFLTALYIMLSYTIMYIAMILITTGDFSHVELSHILFFGLNALLILFSYPFIYLLEKIFGMVTDISLLEYADTNNKLIRELASKAPGTFQHSVQVANMAEEAIRQIGGNPLLVRAGAMYHDIGKSINPIYFTENQPGSYNPHDDLSFEESARIIIDHVVEGVELARKHNVPEQIIDFIRTHHGTKMVEYFYRMSLKEKHKDEIDLKEFTYPGPIPYNRETCVLMMADAVEAASRSIKAPDEKKIDDLVEKIIQSQLDQGQFNNANITLRDINRVKKLFKKRLMSIYHVRIEYPE